MLLCFHIFFFFFFNDTATTEIYTLSLHDALPICSGKLTLERKQVVQIAIVFLCPDEITCASVYQSSLEVKTRAPATVGHGTLQNVRNPKRFTNLANIPLPAILHYAGMADHPEIVDAGEFGQNVVLNTIGKNGVLFIVAQTFE